MAAKINHLCVVGFRGATKPLEIQFDTNKTITLIFGENGTGKSTVADAFDFVCNNKYGSLEDRSFSGQNKSHVATAGQPSTAINVRLTSGTNSWQAILAKTGPTTSNANCPDACILRRSTVLNLINSQASERFAELRGFIDVSGVEKSEKALRDAIMNIDRQLCEAIAASEQAGQALEQLWADEGKPQVDAAKWAKSELKKDVSNLKTFVGEAEKLHAARRETSTAEKLLDTSMDAKQEDKKALQTARENLKKAEIAGAQQNGDLVTLLDKAKTFIAARPDLAACPVCEKPNEAMVLVAQLSERLETLQKLAKLVKDVQVAEKQFASSESVWKKNCEIFCKNAKELASAIQASALPESCAGAMDWEQFKELLEHETPSDTVEREARAFLSKAEKLSENIEKRRETEQKSITLQQEITRYLKTLNTKEQDKKALAKLLATLKALLEVVEGQRKSYVDGILSSISVDVEKLYEKLHPGEGIGKVRFFLNPNKPGSLEMDGEFQGKAGVPFQAYYSESHLDTLGICVFLALANKFKTDQTIVILDDVVTSVDNVHLDRFMQLLHDQASNFNQVIVTTHYRPWRDRYRYAKGPKSNVQVIDLRRWSFEWGIQTDEMKTFVTEIEECLKAPSIDRQVIASKAGIQLENILDFLTLQYHCKLPRQLDPNYTLGAFWSGVSSKLAKQLKTRNTPEHPGDRVETDMQPILDGLMEKTWIRNAEGCHYRSVPSEVPDTEVKWFAEEVVKLSKQLICKDCKSFPMKRPSGSYWQCACGKVELYPLVEPGTPLEALPDEK